MHYKFTAGRTPEDSEKLVLPGIVFVSASHPEYREDVDGDTRKGGFATADVWWDWSVSFMVLWPLQEATDGRE